ncbi:MAG TPA: NADH-quinone oxidoreductase subunit M [Polyangiaceae bacterium]
MVGAPFAAAVLLLMVPDRVRLLVRLVAFAGAATALAASIAVATGYDLEAGGVQLVENYPLVPSIGVSLRLGVDGWAVSLVLLTGIIIVTGVLASWTLENRAKEFFVFLLTLVAGVFGVFVSQDLFIFFLFYEIAVLPMYLLIGIWGSSHKITEAGPFRFVWKLFDIGGREYAAMKLTLMLLIGSAFILVVILAMYVAAGSQSFDFAVLGRTQYSRGMQLWAFPLLWLGFGSLGGVFPFHTWSPDGHASAPTAVSMLHAGVLMKLGAFGVLRIGVMMMPQGALAWAPLVGTIAVVNIVYGALSAMSQSDLKYIVAYSSVSHMGVVMLGIATLTPEGWNGAVYQMFAHGIMTGLFFALVGLVYERAHTRAVPKMGGFARAMPGAAVFFTIAALSSLGLPGTAGFVAEFLVFVGAWQSAHPWWVVPGLLGAFITAVYVLRAARAIFWGPGPSEEFHLTDARRTEWGALVALGSALILFGCWPALVLDFIDRTTPAYLGSVLASYSPPRHTPPRLVSSIAPSLRP